MGAVGLALGGAAFALLRGDDHAEVGTRYGAAFAKGDYQSMYACSPPATGATSRVSRFAELQQEARQTATVQRIRVGQAVKADGDRVRLPVRMETELFGTLRGDLLLPILQDGDRRRWIGRRH